MGIALSVELLVVPSVSTILAPVAKMEIFLIMVPAMFVRWKDAFSVQLLGVLFVTIQTITSS